MSGQSQIAFKMSSCKSSPIKRRTMVKRSSGSYETSETSDQTVAQCQDKLQKLLSIVCSYWVSGPTSIPQSFLRTFLKLCSNSVHFKKRRLIEQAFSKCQEHNAGHAGSQPFLHKFQPFLPDDTIFVKNMKRFARCLKIIRAACFFTDSCHENFPQTQFSSCCQPFSLSQ